MPKAAEAIVSRSPLALDGIGDGPDGVESRATALAIHAAVSRTASRRAAGGRSTVRAASRCGATGKRWNCPTCRGFKRLVVLVALRHSLAVFREARHEVHALTLGAAISTSPPTTGRGTARCDGGSNARDAYASALEGQPDSGRLRVSRGRRRPASEAGSRALPG